MNHRVFYEVFCLQDLRLEILSRKHIIKEKNVDKWRKQMQDKHTLMIANRYCEPLQAERLRHEYGLGGNNVNWRHTAAILGLYYMIEDEV
jgi:hypothetical protein